MMIIPEIDEQTLEELSHVVRVNRTAKTDEELGEHYQAALLDMSRQGIRMLDVSDPLIWQAVKLYTKAYYGYDANTERFLEAYEKLSASISLCGEYSQEGGDTV